MKVILKESLANLGEAGEVVDVKPGYARNYLLPQGFAYEASAANLKRIEEEQKRREEEQKRLYLEARRRAAQLEGMVVTFSARAGEGEDAKLFGSVTAADIAERLQVEAELDFDLDKKHVELEEPIKSLGAFTVPVKLHSEVSIDVDVRVEREEA